MNPTQVFHLPMALKKTKSTLGVNQRRQAVRRDTKLQDVLGATTADINTARNQSVSSAATTKLHSLSDTTTQTANSPSQHGKVPQIPELHLKASSVLLHDEFEQAANTSSSSRSLHLKSYDSSATLHSHYDAHQTPMSISQQTSDSSRRDFALRKGKPVVVKSTTPEQDSIRQLRFFKSSKSRSSDSKKLNKTRPQTGHTLPPEPVTPTDWRSLVDQPSTPKSSKSMIETSKLYKGVRFHNPPPVPFLAKDYLAADIKAKNSLLEPMDPACVKVNIRRPKVGAKHWFDGHEGDSSEDESIDEPEFQQNFVLGIESAFQNNRIKANSSDASTVTTKPLSSTISTDSGSTPRSQLPLSKQPVRETTPQVATLCAKASKSNLSSFSRAQSQKSKSNPLAEKDLNHSSVLNLSSSDDEDEIPIPQDADTSPFGPALRDSAALASSHDSQIELTVAKAETLKNIDPALIKKLKVLNQTLAHEQLRMPIPKRGSSLMLSHLSNQCEPQDTAADLLASFPATPIESLAPSHPTSMRSSVALSEADSVQSRRLMSVTRQEESLLAAMRLKKAAMSYRVTQDKRLEALRKLERGQSRLSDRTPTIQQGLPPISQLSFDTPQSFESAQSSQQQQQQHHSSSDGDNARHSQASGTTFQTTTSRNPSRMSKMTCQTDVSVEPPATRLSLSSSNDSEIQSTAASVLSMSTVDRRQSRDTYFSTSSAGHVGGHSRTLTINSHVVALDDLDKVPTRDGIPSQEFIDWPYKGWEARAELGLAR